MKILKPRNLVVWFFLWAAFPAALIALDLIDESALQEGSEYTLDLRFQSIENDFLVFYDRDGVVVYLRYRIDRWDYEKKEEVVRLLQGMEYRVTFTFSGFDRSIRSDGFVDKNQPPLNKTIRENKGVYSGVYLKSSGLQVERLRL